MKLYRRSRDLYGFSFLTKSGGKKVPKGRVRMLTYKVIKYLRSSSDINIGQPTNTQLVHSVSNEEIKLTEGLDSYVWYFLAY